MQRADGCRGFRVPSQNYAMFQHGGPSLVLAVADLNRGLPELPPLIALSSQ